MLVNSICTSNLDINKCCREGIFTPSFPPIGNINDKKISAEEAYQIINSEEYYDSNPQLNLATFVTTWMEPTGTEVFKDYLDINYIDKLIYPETNELEKICVSILANLYNAGRCDNPTGTSTIGSTEAALLAGLNYKFKWKKWWDGLDIGEPEIIFGSNVQVCWEKFAKYFEVKPIIIPVGSDNRINFVEVARKISDRTICVVGILGDTFTGNYYNIKALNDIADNYNSNHEWKVPIHVDAASGGFVAPFCDKQKKIPWDFRLKWVKSINISGHKYGMVYAGLGWAIWRNREDIDEELVFKVNYLGGEQDDFSLNFSKNASNIIAQYYNLTRLGRQGYGEIIKYLFDIQHYLMEKFCTLKVLGNEIFEVVQNSPGIPIVILKLTQEAKDMGLDLANLAYKIKIYGWSIPAYPLPLPFEDEIVIRIVLRVGFNYSMAEQLYEDVIKTIQSLLELGHCDCIKLGKGSSGMC
ncbi:glutamate decarboxylase [Clostridium sporogenes]|uniref:glutamate decarboxylase n=1 Tax=Clostridium sporogenes TaxID=1509 RepID=UPI003F92A8A9